jgi:hypothetical protein
MKEEIFWMFGYFLYNEDKTAEVYNPDKCVRIKSLA